MIYAGIGGRNTPEDIIRQFIFIGQDLAFKGLTLRSGGAEGADRAFEFGCDCCSFLAKKEIWLPWKGFNNSISTLVLEDIIPEGVIEIASSTYDRWWRASDSIKRLHSRNVYQILGHDLNTPVDFVVCWTDRNKHDTGGTNFGIKLAEKRKIPVYNFHNHVDEILFNEYIKGIKRGE